MQPVTPTQSSPPPSLRVRRELSSGSSSPSFVLGTVLPKRNRIVQGWGEYTYAQVFAGWGEEENTEQSGRVLSCGGINRGVTA